MSTQVSEKTMVCTEYQRLLEACAKAREVWKEHRAEICRARLAGRDGGDDVLRSQVKYAQAHLLLRNHVERCYRCQLVPKMA